MKTNDEIQREAQRMVVLGRKYRDEQRLVATGPEIVPLPRELVRLPDSAITVLHEDEPEAEARHVHRRERYVEAALEKDELMFRLMERETEANGVGHIVRVSEPALLMDSRSGHDLLHHGYELVEEDRLAELLTPYAERGEGGDPADEKSIQEVEGILETSVLSQTDRLRARAEIADFLEGRLEPSVFIAHAIDRQCAREGHRQRQAHRHEMRLTIDN